MKNTKRALLSSVLALVLCFAMLLGTTYAWFTDSVTSGSNVIVSGNLDVALYNGLDTSADEVTGETKLFQMATPWEPGALVYENLTVANEGTLALKYQLAVNITAFTGEKSLADVLKVGVVEEGVTATTREEVIASVKEWIPFASFIKSGSLAAKTATEIDTDTYGIVIYWEPSAIDNDYNMNQGQEPLTATIGVVLSATQDTVESDSFDNYYDGDAAEWNGDADISWYNLTATEVTIGNPEQLAGLAAIVNGQAVILAAPSETSENGKVQDSFAGKTITLASDIDLGNIAWTPIGNWDNAFNGTFNGNGHTISNLYINDTNEETGSGVGFFGVTEGATITGITLENVDITGYEMTAGLVGAAYPATISDCHIIGDVDISAEWAYVAGIAGYCYYGTQVSNCSVIADDMGNITAKDRNAVGGITAWLLEGDHKVLNCHVENLNLTGWTNVGSITGFVHYNNTISGCTVENVNLTKTRGDGNPGIGLIAGGYSYSEKNAITLKNNTVNGATLNGTHIAYTSYNNLYGSEYGGSTKANFVLEKNTVENITSELVEVAPIKDVAGLKAALTTGGKYVLKADLALTETITVPNGVEVVLYMNGKTIAATSTKTGENFAAINVGKGGVLTVNGGTLTTEHKGENMGWNNSTQVFDVVSGGTLNLNNVYVKNLGGSDMAYAVNIGNNGGATLNTNASTLESVEYNALRIFNNADGAINVNLANGTVLTGEGSPFFVHFWTKADLGDKMEARQAYLKLSFNDTKVSRYSGSKSLIRFGFTDAIYYSSTAMNEVVAGNEKALKWALENGKNVLLNNDIAISESIINTKEVVLDLNGKTLSYTSTVAAASCAINNKGTLTIKNGTVTYEGIGDTSFGYGTNTINNTGYLTIENGAKIVNTTPVGSSVAIDCAANATLVVNGGEITSVKNAIRLCPFGNAPINATFNGGVVTGARAIQIQLPSSNAESAPEINLTINGGTFSSNSDNGMSIYSYSAGQSFANVKVTFNGGIFTHTVAFGGGNAKTTQETVTVNKGTFNSYLGRYTANDNWEDITVA